MKWHVFKKDDPSTYPEIDCPMLVCKYWGDDIDLEVHHFNNQLNKFYVRDCGHYKAYDECFYAYIGYVPRDYKVHNPIGCGYVDDHWGNYYCPCGFEDHGYCMCDDGFKCEHQVVRNEYEIVVRKIWKEFE